MSDSIIYPPRPDIASESGSGALVAIYRRAIERYEEQPKGGPETAPNDSTKGSKGDRVGLNIQGCPYRKPLPMSPEGQSGRGAGDVATKGFRISEKEKGGRHVEHPASSPSEVDDQRFRKSTQE